MMKKILKVLLIVVIAIAVAFAGYFAYLMIQYSRIEDNLALDVAQRASGAANVNEEYSIATWNLGFGAYSDDYSFFMDGGTESRARSKEAVVENISGMLERLKALNPDFLLLQEMDTDATRSRHVNEREMAEKAFPEKSAAFAVNYHSAYLFYPLYEPHGASNSGILTLSNCEISSALRRSLPVETGLTKFLDLDRCYSVSRIPVSNGKTLCLYNLHLSAYTSDGTIADDQLKMLIADMQAEYEAGNYVVGGGDFNKDLLGDSADVFGVSGEGCMWAQPIPDGLIGGGIRLAAAENPVPSCRNADRAYVQGESFVVTVDGFLVSGNVEICELETIDAGFEFSDHNPVRMTFILTD